MQALGTLLKTKVPIDVTELGIVIEVREVQFWNAQLSIIVTELGMVIEVRAEQFWNV